MTLNPMRLAVPIALALAVTGFASPTSGPSLNSPECVRVPQARGEQPSDEELGVGRNGEYCAYPVRMMAYHRVVNDHLGGPPILVTYDPDSAAGKAFDPVLEGRAYTFDAQPAEKGLPVLKDRETGSVWSSITGEAMTGPLAGKRLTRLHSLVLTWSRWKALHPSSWVLAEDPRQSQHYVSRSAAPIPALPTVAPETGKPHSDKRLLGDALVLGIAAGDGATALPLTDRRGGYAAGPAIRETSVGNETVAVFLDPGAHAAAAFSPKAKGRALHFRTSVDAAPPTWTDRETGSTWTIEGICTGGELKGESLVEANAVRVRWYAWSALHPATAILKSR